MADDQLGVTPTDLDPEIVHNLLNMESQGQIPETIKPHIARARAAGILPPPLLGPTNPTGFSNKPQAIPQPQMGMKDRFLAAIPDTMDWVKSTGKSLLDPEAIGGVVGGVGGSYIGQPVLGAGAGAAMGNIVHQTYDTLTNPTAHTGIPSLTPAAGAFVSGAVGEGLSKLPGAALRRPVTPAGAAVEGFFGRKNTMAHQMVDSPLLDFVANVAKYGPGGKSTMERFEQQQSQKVLDHIQDVSHWVNNGKPTSIDPLSGQLDLGAAGQNFQSDVSQQLGQLPKTSGFDTFLQNHGTRRFQVPNAQGSGMVDIGPSVAEGHQARSEALAAGRRFGKGTPERQAAVASAAKSKAGVERALPDQAARDEYNTLLDNYQAEKQRIDNPTVKALRTGPSNDVIDNIIDGKLKNAENLKTGTGFTSEQLLGRVQKAASPDAWNQLQADTIHRLGERSMKDGVVDPGAMKSVLDGIDEPTKRKLFGNALSDINSTLSVLTQANKYKESETGRLFIAIRTGQAGIAAITKAAALPAAVIGAGSYAGGREGHPIAGGLAGAGAVLISPYAFSKMLTSEVGRALLTRAVKGGSNTVMQQTKRGISRFIAQNVTEGARESIQGDNQTQSNDVQGIPEPPK